MHEIAFGGEDLIHEHQDEPPMPPKTAATSTPTVLSERAVKTLVSDEVAAIGPCLRPAD